MTRPPLEWCIRFLVGLAMQSVLPLDELHLRHPGLTPPLAASYSEGAAICLQRHHEHPPKDFKIEHETDHQRSLIATAMWTKPDERCFRAWANEDDATRDGAYGMALAAVEVADGLVAHRRAETLSGGDWYLVPSGSGHDDLENSILFEVSGISISDDAKEGLNNP